MDLTRQQGRLRARLERRTLWASAALALAACSQNTGGAPTVEFDRPAPNPNPGLGFDPGVDLGANLEFEVGLCGALIPGPAGGPERRLAFFAFASGADAATLERDPSPPIDGNGLTDVFLAAVADTRISVGGAAQPAIFSQAMLNAYRHARCITCHGFHYAGGFGSAGGNHPGGASQQNNQQCTVCHDVDIGLGEHGEEIPWLAPLQAVNGEIGFGGKTAQELCQQTKLNVADPVAHFRDDPKIFWAFERALTPQGLVVSGGPAPFEKLHFDELVAAWVQGGCACESSSAVRDVALASRAATGNQAADAGSRRPSLAFVHNPLFDPDNPLGTNPAGWVYLALESEATDLVAGFADHNGPLSDVFRARVAVRMDEDPSLPPGTLLAGAVNLLSEPAQTLLASFSEAGGSNGGNGASSRPAISSGAGFVAFESLATAGAHELVDGFVDGNGAFEPDVYLASLDAAVDTALVSRASGTQGGNARSGAPAISPRGDAVAFETLADDLDFADTNGVQDVYYASVDTATNQVLALFRASVRTGGLQASGGDSRRPAVFVDPSSGEVLVAFESEKTDLVGPIAGLPLQNVYLHRGPTALVTSLLSQVSTASKAELPDGASLAPALSPDGRWLAYETAATNLDVLRPLDGNASQDLILVNLSEFLASGRIAGQRLSVAAEGVDAQGGTTAVLLAGFKNTQNAFDTQALGAFATSAQNLGTAQNTDRILSFIQE